MLQQFNLSEFFSQSVRCLKIIGESYDFYKKHKLWKGLFEHKWITLATVILSIIFTFVVFSNLYDFLFPFQEIAEGLDNNGNKKIVSSNKDTAIFGGSKFLFLILLEIVIFHFSVKTLEVLNNEKYETTFTMFVSAEIRMIKVMIRSAIQSLIVQVLLSIILGITDLEFTQPLLMFIVHSYFIGVAFFDNYNEQQKLNIKESDISIRHQSGAATTLGVVASIGLMIPVIGPLAVPVLGAISSNIYGFRHHMENPADPKPEKGEVEEMDEIV